MPKTKFNKAVSTAIALSIVANVSVPISANQLIPFTGKIPFPWQTVGWAKFL